MSPQTIRKGTERAVVEGSQIGIRGWRNAGTRGSRPRGRMSQVGAGRSSQQGRRGSRRGSQVFIKMRDICPDGGGRMSRKRFPLPTGKAPVQGTGVLTMKRTPRRMMPYWPTRPVPAARSRVVSNRPYSGDHQQFAFRRCPPRQRYRLARRCRVAYPPCSGRAPGRASGRASP